MLATTIHFVLLYIRAVASRRNAVALLFAVCIVLKLASSALLTAHESALYAPLVV